ncbi:MAG: hypothetical protein ACTHN3_07760 [Solirubrobacterales bacterium]
MSLSAAVKWVLLALVGVAIAIGVAIAAANLTSQQIGIANESVSAGDALAPSLTVPAEGKPHRRTGDHGGPDEGTPTTIPAEPRVVEPTPEEPSFEEPAPSAEEPSSPNAGEPSSPKSESKSEDRHGPDGDD